MTDEKLWLLVSLQLSGEATPAQIEELQMLIQHDPQVQFRIAVIQQIWQARNISTTEENKAMSFDKHLQRLSNHLGTPVLQFDYENASENAPSDKVRPKFKFGWQWMIATVAALFILVLLIMHSDPKGPYVAPKLAGNTISTKSGSKSKVELPDGTNVWLNADSKLEYKGDFSGKYREVTLSGEAYFDVVKDKSRPFIIHTRTVRIRVLGTAFNVRSYPADKTTETALIRGSLEVTLNTQPDKKVILKPNEKVLIEDEMVNKHIAADTPDKEINQDMMIVSSVHLDKKDNEVYETMWLNNKLAFDETPFDNMIAEIERWYNVEIIVKNKSLSQNTYTVTFENKTLDEVLEGLQFSAHFQYQLKNGVVTIW